MTVSTIDRIATHVVIRHTCHCKTAAEAPPEGEPEEHVFTIDGEDFPWLISERGPIVTQLTDDLFSVDVEVVLFGRCNHQHLSFGYTGRGGAPPYIPVIAGKEFPWVLTGDSCELKVSHKMVPTLHLAFLARNVTGNVPIEDKRPAIGDRAIYCSGGDIVDGTKEECNWCHELCEGFTGLFEHIEQHHPEQVRDHNGHKSYRVS